ncbi:uncharacterized protein BDV14DRAFT_21798 [Aspergillus stella-maris]|uniref:uncharacterized protein n=1 Tax=Aspergillus stella-maris TaxID=1810926 RepID=UPI003CCDF7EB
MPLKLRGSLARSLPRRKDVASKTPNPCPSCTRNFSTRRSTNSHALSSTLLRTQTPLQTRLRNPVPRLQSLASAALYSTAPSTAHTARHVPPRLRELYESLAHIQSVAPEEVNLSRLQLALRGLESEEPLLRVAVLGLNDVAAARKLVRLLLADPLKGREDWEDMLDELSENGDLEKGLLIRYGEASGSISNYLVPTISVPSQILKKGNLEILVTSLGTGADASGAQLSADTFLVPTVTIQTSHTGRHNVVRYPVHRSIVCAEGVDGLLAYSGLLSQSDLRNEAGSIYAAIELGESGPNINDNRISFVDTNKADEALAKFRESVRNAALYERGWNSSGIQPVIEWLSSARANEGTLDPSLRSLISSLIDSAEQGVAARETKRLQEQEEASVPEHVRASLDQTVSTWAEKSHTELRSALEEGFATKKWRGLAWWKLFWRVDDVGMITSEILQEKYLRRAEKDVIYTSGQLEQTGLQVQEQPQPQEPAEQTTPESQNLETTSAPEKPEEPATAETEKTPSNVAVSLVEPPTEAEGREPTPWPTQIPLSRKTLLENTVPSLQAMAQRLVLFSISTTSLTSALSVLTYVSFSTAGIYETCTIAAVGLIYSLRRQQTKWERARAFWEDEVRDTGRTALRETEGQLRRSVWESGKVQLPPAVTVQDARRAIERAREALRNVH